VALLSLKFLRSKGYSPIDFGEKTKRYLEFQWRSKEGENWGQVPGAHQHNLQQFK